LSISESRLLENASIISLNISGEQYLIICKLLVEVVIGLEEVATIVILLQKRGDVNPKRVIKDEWVYLIKFLRIVFRGLSCRYGEK